MILTLQTNSFGFYGGIPTYNRLVCRVLNDLGWKGGNSVLIAMDKEEDVKRASELHPNLLLSGFGGNRAKFATAALTTLARERIDLVLAGHVHYLPLCMLLKALQPRLRIGVFIYGWDVWHRMPLIRRWAVRRADFLVSISSYTKQRAVAMNQLSSERTFIVPNAIEWTTSETAFTPDSFTLPQGVRLLSVGRLDAAEQQKGFDTVIESLPSIAARVPNVQYIIVGDGTDLERHKQLAANVGVSDRVHFLGSVDEGSLRYCYQSCDLFVMPSAQEGFGFVYLEAMQCGKPIVAANSGGAPEVVKDGVTGLLVEYGNKQQLSDALTRLCLDQKLRIQLGQAGNQRLQDHFTFEHFKRRLTGILLRELPSRVTRQFAKPDKSASCAS